MNVNFRILDLNENPLDIISMYDLKEGDIIYNDKLQITKFLVESEQAKIYTGYIKEINTNIIVKRYILTSYDYNIAERLVKEIENLRSMKHVNICKYYDVVYVKQFKVINFKLINSSLLWTL